MKDVENTRGRMFAGVLLSSRWEAWLVFVFVKISSEANMCISRRNVGNNPSLMNGSVQSPDSILLGG